MGTARCQYTDELKQEALGLLVSSGRPLSEIAGELGIPPAGMDLAVENARLRRENERLRTEREILKKHFASSRNHQNEIPPHRRRP
jgi:transposase-like protein